MENTSYIALSRQMSLRTEMNIVANNIANANTPAYKAEKVVFQEFLDRTKDRENLSFVQDIGLARDIREGPMSATNNPLDVAISGEGYFVIETPLGDRYTRHGRFQMDATGQLVNSEGDALKSNGAPLVIPNGTREITIAADGSVSADEFAVGKISVVKFEDEFALKKGANGLYTTDQDPEEITQPQLVQGMLEDSNVEPILELTRMITVQREYQSVQKFIKAENDRMKKAIERLSRQS